MAMAVSDTGVWLRQGDDTSQIVIHAQHVDQGGVVLRNVKMIEEERLYSGSQPTSDFAFARRIDADRPPCRTVSGSWKTSSKTFPTSHRSGKQTSPSPLRWTPSHCSTSLPLPTRSASGACRVSSSQTQAAGLDASRYRMRWHALMATPALFVAMGLIGAVVCLRLQRMGGTSQLLAIGALAAIGLYFFTQFSTSLGATGAAPPIVAAWSPPLFVLFCTLLHRLPGRRLTRIQP
jgi:lipopolysaccharide export system permease protein